MTRDLLRRVTYSYEQFLKQLGERLRAMRIERGWSLRDMIVHQGYHLIQWQNLEKGKGLSVPSLLRLCGVFNVKLTDLVDGLGEHGPASADFEAKAVTSSAKRAAKAAATATTKAI